VNTKNLATILALLQTLNVVIPEAAAVVGLIVGWYQGQNPHKTSAEVRADLRLHATSNMEAVDAYLAAHPDVGAPA
jgi:hypothetical protein